MAGAVGQVPTAQTHPTPHIQQKPSSSPISLPPPPFPPKVANILSGNYCQPRCAEPWIEVIFEGEAEGKVQVIVSPLVRLTNRKNVTIQDVGDPSGILTSLGPFITGEAWRGGQGGLGGVCGALASKRVDWGRLRNEDARGVPVQCYGATAIFSS